MLRACRAQKSLSERQRIRTLGFSLCSFSSLSCDGDWSDGECSMDDGMWWWVYDGCVVTVSLAMVSVSSVAVSLSVPPHMWVMVMWVVMASELWRWMSRVILSTCQVFVISRVRIKKHSGFRHAWCSARYGALLPCLWTPCQARLRLPRRYR
jgi:hypothetical protein